MRHHTRTTAAASSFQPIIPVAVLPEQLHVQLQGRGAPERRLIAALLQDAIRCFESPDDLGLAREAEKWIMDQHPDAPFTFDSVCFFLGLNPDAVRGSVQRRKGPTG